MSYTFPRLGGPANFAAASGYTLPEAGAVAFALGVGAGQYATPPADTAHWEFESGYTAPSPAAVDFTWGGDAPEPPLLPGLLVRRYRSRWSRQQRRDIQRRSVLQALPVRDQTKRASWDVPTPKSADVAAPWGSPAAQSSGVAASWQATRHRPGRTTDHDWRQVPPKDAAPLAAGWDALTARQAQTVQPWIVPPEKDRSVAAGHDSVDRYGPDNPTEPPPVEIALPLDDLPWTFTSGYAPPPAAAADFSFTDTSYRPPMRNPELPVEPIGNVPIQPRRNHAAAPWGDPPPQDSEVALPWDPAIPRRADIGIRYPMQPPEPKPEPLPPHLAKVYSLMATIEVYRLPERTPVLCNAVSATTDRDSWCWQFQLTPARREDMALLQPDSEGPKEIEIQINGYIWTALVEGYDRRRAFANSSFSLSARSTSAYLSDRYAPARSIVQDGLRSAQQLALEELLNTGWTLDWQAPDWTVPGGIWSYQELPPMQVILEILSASGATIQSHPSEQRLTVRPRYPVSPWEWATTTPDAVLPEAQVVSESGRWEPRPAYNAIYVAGQAGGVLVHVKRRNTAGELVAPMQLHRLITEVAAGMERGRNELAGSGNKELVTLQAPLLPDPWQPGLLLPGQLLEVQGSESWRGLITGVSISATRQNATTVRQTIEVERHYG